MDGAKRGSRHLGKNSNNLLNYCYYKVTYRIENLKLKELYTMYVDRAWFEAVISAGQGVD